MCDNILWLWRIAFLSLLDVERYVVAFPEFAGDSGTRPPWTCGGGAVARQGMRAGLRTSTLVVVAWWVLASSP
jgi:hypothetical protein